MDVYECIRSRRTVREFKLDPVPDEIVHKLLQAGRWAPSSSNTQPWHFVVVSNRETLAAIGRIATQGTFIGQAPLAIAIVMENARRPQLDAGRALQQMELVAWSEGLGTCFVGLRAAEQQDTIKDLLGIPKEMELVTVLPFGYRPEGRRTGGTPRKPMDEMAPGEIFGTADVPHPTNPLL
jgi:nitroreductase